MDEKYQTKFWITTKKKKKEENKTINETIWNIFVARFSFGVHTSLVYIIYFAILLFTSTNNLLKHSGLILNYILFSFSKWHSERRIHTWYLTDSKAAVLKYVFFKTLQNSHENIIGRLQIRSPETSLKIDFGTGIFLWIFCNFSKNLSYRTPLDDCSCWFLCSNQSFIHWSHFVHFFPSFFLFHC